MSETAKTRSPQRERAERFVEAIIKRCAQDKGYAAHLKRADNPATEYQAWEILASFGVDLARDAERIPFAVVGAAIARAGIESNGMLGLGKALALYYEDGSESQPARARLRRLLACRDVVELCRVLRPVLSLLQGKGVIALDYAGLLHDLLTFRWRAQEVQARWAMDFFSTYQTGEEGGQDADEQQ